MAHPHRLESMFYHITSECNLSCKHCWLKAKDPAINELNLEEAKKVIVEAIELGLTRIKISGGEPFIVPWICEFAEFVSDQGVNITFETNGTLITEQISNHISKMRTEMVCVSLDGSNAKIHENLRGQKGCFDATLEGIKLLCNNGLSVHILTAVYKDNLDDLPSIIVLAEQLGAESIKFNIISDMGRAVNLKGKFLSPKDHVELYRHVEEWQKDRSIKIQISYPYILCPTSKLGHHACMGCDITKLVGLLGDGTLAMCAVGYVNKDTIYGNIRERSIKDIWKINPPPLLKKIRTGVPDNLTGVCSQCILKNSCLGGCRAQAYSQYGSVLAPEPTCQKMLEAGFVPKERLFFEEIPFCS